MTVPRTETLLPCETCGKHHTRSATRGFYAEDGHPYKAQQLKPVETASGWTSTILGIAVECPNCGALVNNRRHAIARHQERCK